MSLEFCTTCKSDTGYVCGTCGKPRDFKAPGARGGPHRLCARRRSKGYSKPCPAHTEVTARCDYCRTTALARHPTGIGGRGNYHRVPEGWVPQTQTINGLLSTLDACPSCAAKLAIASDAIVDDAKFREQRDVAVARLIRMLDWVTPEIAEALGREHPTARVRLWDALGRARGVVGNNGHPTGGDQGTVTERTRQPVGVVVAHNADGTVLVATGNGSRLSFAAPPEQIPVGTTAALNAAGALVPVADAPAITVTINDPEALRDGLEAAMRRPNDRSP